ESHRTAPGRIDRGEDLHTEPYGSVSSLLAQETQASEASLLKTSYSRPCTPTAAAGITCRGSKPILVKIASRRRSCDSAGAWVRRDRQALHPLIAGRSVRPQEVTGSACPAPSHRD